MRTPATWTEWSFELRRLRCLEVHRCNEYGLEEAVLQKKILSHSEEPSDFESALSVAPGGLSATSIRRTRHQCLDFIRFVMNGGLIVGTMDGANIEIREECGNLAPEKVGRLCHFEPARLAERSHDKSCGRNNKMPQSTRGEDTMFIFGCLEHEASRTADWPVVRYCRFHAEHSGQ